VRGAISGMAHAVSASTHSSRSVSRDGIG
jgi:hypothetical protein